MDDNQEMKDLRELIQKLQKEVEYLRSDNCRLLEDIEKLREADSIEPCQTPAR